MSLFQAVHGTVNRPPYANASYYGQITHPSPLFADLMAKVAVRLGGGQKYARARSLWRLDQAMGGGKSHGLIGLWHLAKNPAALGPTDVGRAAFDKAAQILDERPPTDLNNPVVVVLACDNMTAGKGAAEFDGPAQTLHERFLWRLFGGDNNLYLRYRDGCADKNRIVEALTAVGRPVLILVDDSKVGERIVEYDNRADGKALAAAGQDITEQALEGSNAAELLDRYVRLFRTATVLHNNLKAEGNRAQKFMTDLSDLVERSGEFAGRLSARLGRSVDTAVPAAPATTPPVDQSSAASRAIPVQSLYPCRGRRCRRENRGGLPADADASLVVRGRGLVWRRGLTSRVAHCCLEQCDMRSHVVSEYVGGGWTEVEDVVRASVGARSLPDVRGWVLLSWVRSSGKSPRITVPSGDHRPGEDWVWGERQ
jgi:hypothetical protein